MTIAERLVDHDDGSGTLAVLIGEDGTPPELAIRSADVSVGPTSPSIGCDKPNLGLMPDRELQDTIEIHESSRL